MLIKLNYNDYMRKDLWRSYLPIIAFIGLFTAFIVGQVIFDLTQTNAEQTTKQKEEFVFYEDLFKRATFPTAEGGSLKLTDRNEPVIILNFWASWCTPCLVEFPSLVELKEKFPNQVFVLGINSDEEEPLKKIEWAETGKLLKDPKGNYYSLNFRSIADIDNSILNEFKVSTLPVSIIFFNGKVYQVSRKVKNFMSKDFLEQIERAIKS